MNFTELLQIALKRAGKNEQLAIALDLSPSALSRRINGEIGWAEIEVNRLLTYTACDITNSEEYTSKLQALKTTLRIVLNESDGKDNG